MTDFRDHATVGGGETNSGKALVVTVSKGAAEVTEVPVGEWTFEAVDRELMGEEDVAEFLAALDLLQDRTAINGLQHLDDRHPAPREDWRPAVPYSQRSTGENASPACTWDGENWRHW